MQIPVIRANQNGKEFFVTVLSANDVAKLTKVDEWHPVTKKGYQRAAEEPHVNAIARYLSASDAVLPTAIFLNSRRALGFREMDGNQNVGTISLNPQDFLWNVDGQHRVKGLKKAIEEKMAELKGFGVPVVIASGLTPYEEMQQFLTINKTQKGVNTGLTEELYEQKAQTDKGYDELVEQGRMWIVKAGKIADYLNETKGSPWYKRIQMPNTKIKAPAKRQSINKSLQPLLKGGFLEQHSEGVACQLLLAYWKAVEDVFPKAFEKPEDYAIQKTAGFFPLHTVANRIFWLCQSDPEKFKQSNMAAYLKKATQAADIDDNFWKVSNKEGATLYGSMKGFRLLSDKILRKLPPPKIQGL